MADLIEVHAIYAQMSNMTPRPLLLKFQVIAGVNIHYYNTVCLIPKILREQLDFEIGSMCFSKFKTVNPLQC